MNRSSSIPSSSRAVVIGAMALAAIAYFVALHLLIVDHTMARLTLMLIAAPWLIAAASACGAAMAPRPVPRVLLTVLVFAVPMGLVARYGAVVHDHVDALAYLENLIFVLSLAGAFAVSLTGPRDALVTRLARVARRGDMPPSVISYTRRVTVAWALFFATAAAVSTVLFAAGSRESWSAFVNLALWPLTVLAFGVEYAIRVRSLPQIEHSSPLAGMRLFLQRDRYEAADATGREHG